MEVDENCERLQTGVSFVHHSFLTISFLRMLETRAMIKFMCKVEAENACRSGSPALQTFGGISLTSVGVQKSGLAGGRSR